MTASIDDQPTRYRRSGTAADIVWIEAKGRPTIFMGARLLCDDAGAWIRPTFIPGDRLPH